MTAWGMQFSTFNAYPSAAPVPKEIFADVLHAVPVAASITILRRKYVLLGFFKLLQHTVRIVLKRALDAARMERATSRGLGVSECAGCCARAVTRASWCRNAYLVRSPEKE